MKKSMILGLILWALAGAVGVAGETECVAVVWVVEETAHWEGTEWIQEEGYWEIIVFDCNLGKESDPKPPRENPPA